MENFDDTSSNNVSDTRQSVNTDTDERRNSYGPKSLINGASIIALGSIIKTQLKPPTLDRLLVTPKWQGIGGIVAIIALGISIIQIVQSYSPPVETVSSVVRTPETSVNRQIELPPPTMPIKITKTPTPTPTLTPTSTPTATHTPTPTTTPTLQPSIEREQERAVDVIQEANRSIETSLLDVDEEWVRLDDYFCGEQARRKLDQFRMWAMSINRIYRNFTGRLVDQNQISITPWSDDGWKVKQTETWHYSYSRNGKDRCTEVHTDTYGYYLVRTSNSKTYYCISEYHTANPIRTPCPP